MNTRKRIRFSAAIGLIVGLVGCQASAPTPAPKSPADSETVGALAPSYNSIAVAPVHHDAPPDLGGVTGTDDDEPTDTGLDVLRREAAKAGAVDVSAKTDGVTVGGENRQ